MTDSGWHKSQIALDVKAENARELGLDYEVHSCSHLCTQPMCVAVREAVQAEREACEALHQHEDVLAPVGNSSWGEAYQEGWAHGTAAYREAIKARALEEYCDALAQPEQKPVGTVEALFDENVILWRGLDRNLLVYTYPPAAQPAQSANLVSVVQAHIKDLRACLPTLLEYAEMSQTATEVEKAADELEAALNEPPAALVQEPDCWAILTPHGSRLVSHDEAKGRKDAYPLYTTPPAAQPAPVQDLVDEVIGCFEAAEIEGLADALASTTDEHLKDLVERRLMHVLYAAKIFKEKSE